MGRPREFDREAALQTVMHEIWRQGYEACSVKTISEKLGITRSSFYNSFGNRESLFREVLALYAQGSPDRVLNDIDEHTPVPEALYTMFREVCRVRAADKEGRGCMALNCVAELVGSNDAIGPVLEEALSQNIERFNRLVQAGVKKGEIQVRDVRATGLALQNLLAGINIMSKVVRSEEELWAIAENTLAGLGIAPAGE